MSVLDEQKIETYAKTKDWSASWLQESGVLPQLLHIAWKHRNNTEPHVFVVKQEQEQEKIAAATFAADAIKTGDKKQGPIRRGGKASFIPVTLSKFESVMKTSQCNNFNYNNLNQ